MAILGLVLAVVFLLWGTGGQNLKYLFDPASFIMVGVTTLGLLLFAGGRIPAMFRAVFARSPSSEVLRAGIEGWKKARIYALSAGLLGGLVGLILMLDNLSEPSRIGPGMAVAVISGLYALGIAFVFCLPLQARLEDRLGESTDPSAFGSAVLYYLYGFFLCFSVFLVLQIAMSRA